MEKKIRAKDQLFEDALASTVACGSGTGIENRSLTAELKKRLMKMKARNEEAEQEIQRLTKTVKIVEVEVKEETGPLEERIHLLENQKYDLQ